MTHEEVKEQVISYIGEGVHTGLRKWCESEESHKAWIAIRDMPGEEWGNIATEIAKLILSIPEILIKNPNQSLPKNPFEDESKQTSFGHQKGFLTEFFQYRNGQQDILKENWVKVLPKEEK